MHEHAEEKSVYRGAGGLIQCSLDEGVGLVKARLNKAAAAGFVVELGFVAGRGGGDSFSGRSDVIGREGGFEEFLPKGGGGVRMGELGSWGGGWGE